MKIKLLRPQSKNYSILNKPQILFIINLIFKNNENIFLKKLLKKNSIDQKERIKIYVKKDIFLFSIFSNTKSVFQNS